VIGLTPAAGYPHWRGRPIPAYSAHQMARYAAVIFLLAALAGCGETSVREEPSITVTGGQARDDEAPGVPAGEDAPRIAVVTHGQASSPFWAIVRTGVEAAERQMNVQVDYEAPDVYSLPKMIELVEDAVATKPDGLVVSFPEPGLAPAIRRAVRAGIPVITINSGSDTFRSLGVLSHVGQPEGRAGLAAGRRLARAGVRRALCVNQQVGNVGLDARCDGLRRAMAAAGGSARVLGIDDQSPATPAKIAAAITSDRIDGVLATNSTGGLLAVEALAKTRRRAKVASFDLGPDTLRAIEQGKLLFAVDQQPYLQGYLPVVMLANRARYGLLPAQGDVVATGANFVTRANAAQALELSERSIR
jgi:simple sugar transport system substrate-binding protein